MASTANMLNSFAARSCSTNFWAYSPFVNAYSKGAPGLICLNTASIFDKTVFSGVAEFRRTVIALSQSYTKVKTVRSEERCVGTEGVRNGRYRGYGYQEKQKKTK